MSDDGLPATSLEFAGEYEELLAACEPMTEFPDFDENTRATTFYSTGTTGLPKGVYFSHRQLVLHTLAALATITSANQGRLCRQDVYMPLTPMFHVHAWGIPYVATMIGVKQVYPGTLHPRGAAQAARQRRGHLLPLRAQHPQHAGERPRGGPRRPLGLEGD